MKVNKFLIGDHLPPPGSTKGYLSQKSRFLWENQRTSSSTSTPVSVLKMLQVDHQNLRSSQYCNVLVTKRHDNKDCHGVRLLLVNSIAGELQLLQRCALRDRPCHKPLSGTILRDSRLHGFAIWLLVACNDFRIVVAVHVSAEDSLTTSAFSR